MMITNFFNLISFSVFTEYFIAVVIIYVLIVLILLLKNIKGILIQNVFSEFLAFIMFASCFLTYYDNQNVFGFINHFNSNYNNSILVDNVSTVSKIVICFFSSIFFIITSEFFNKFKITFEFLLLLLFAILGLIFICSSGDLVLTFLSIELVSLVSYLLTGFRKKSISSVESSIKYLIVGAVSSSFFVFGVSFIYLFTGSFLLSDYTILFFDCGNLFFYEFNSMNVTYSVIEIGLFFVVLSVFIKLSLAPFHFWSLEVYENAPIIASFFFSAITKFSFIVLLFRLLVPFINHYHFLIADLFLTIGLISVFIGSFGNLQQNKVKTFMAYSSINHMGFVILAFSNFTGSNLVAGIYYIVIYIITNILLWYAILIVSKNKHKLKNSIDFSDLLLCYKSNSVLAFGLLVGFCSSSGLPPFIGFLAKFQILFVLVQSKYYLVSFLVAICSLISTFYYLKVVKIIYFENSFIGNLYDPINTNKILIFCLLTFSLIFLLIKPNLLYLFIQYFILKLYL